MCVLCLCLTLLPAPKGSLTLRAAVVETHAVYTQHVCSVWNVLRGKREMARVRKSRKKQKWNKRLLSLNYLRIYRLFTATVLEKSTRLVLNFIYVLSIDFVILGFCHFLLSNLTGSLYIYIKYIEEFKWFLFNHRVIFVTHFFKCNFSVLYILTFPFFQRACETRFFKHFPSSVIQNVHWRKEHVENTQNNKNLINKYELFFLYNFNRNLTFMSFL